MGGGGGSFFSRSKDEYKKDLDDIKQRTLDADYEREVDDALRERLADSNTRDVDRHNEYLDGIKECIEADNDGIIELKFGGSVKKYTYVDGLSDVDVLVLVNKSELADKSPHEILDYIAESLSRKLKNVENIRVGTLAVTVTYKDGTEIQLLPALKHGDGYRIPSEKGNDWSQVIRPDKFASRLTEVNESCSNKVVPTIKLIKGINRQLPEDQQLSGYHIESLAIEIFKSYPEDRPAKPKEMLKYFFQMAPEKVKQPIKDRTGQSIHVDDYLGRENSPQRLRSSYALSRISTKLKNADAARSVEEWESILGDKQ
jgi:predicted nucleotidyltransferase